MALSANTVLEVRTTGSDTNGGGFVTGASGTDWSQQDAAQYSVTDGVTNGTTTITSATANFGTDVVGNLIYVQGGTGSVAAGWYQIISRTNSTTIVVDRSTGLTAGTGVTLKIGGALATLGQAGAIATVAGMITYVKYSATPYTATTASTNVANGCVLGTSSTWYQGYDTTRSLFNTDANRPTFRVDSGVSSATLFTGTNSVYRLANFILDGQSQTSSRGMFQSGFAWNVKAQNFTNGAFIANTSTTGAVAFCEITGCSTVNCVSLMMTVFACEAYSNTVTPFSGGNHGRYYNCLAYNNSGATTDGFEACFGANNVAYNNGRHGFYFGNNNSLLLNSIAESNGAYGFFQNTVSGHLVNCGSYNNTSGRSSAGSGFRISDISPITGSGSFFVDAANGNFSLNNTANAGALLRAAGFPAVFPRGLTANYPDIGAAQHQDSGGGVRQVNIRGGADQ